MNRKYKRGHNRKQTLLFPPLIDEIIPEDSIVRYIDIYVSSIDMEKSGFRNAENVITPGQPAYPPDSLLKLFLYAIMNGKHSSRKLEHEAWVNLELIWLLDGLRPGYKTIADFRKNNVEAIKQVNKNFIELIHDIGLLGKELVGIDGSFLKGNVGKKSIYTDKKIKKKLQNIEKHIQSFLEEMERIDEEENIDNKEIKKKIKEKIEELKKHQQTYQERQEKLKDSGNTQIAEVDEDARLLTKNGQTIAGYNTQIAVDDKHNLIIYSEVTQEGNDKRLLSDIAEKAKNVLGKEELTVAADAGYFSGKELNKCKDKGINAYVPVVDPPKNKAAKEKGLYEKKDFKYSEEDDCFVCPAGRELTRKKNINKYGKEYRIYVSSQAECKRCLLRNQCLSKVRREKVVYVGIANEIVLRQKEKMKKEGAEIMRRRAAIVEHPFGTMKRWWGWDHFRMRGLEKVEAEMSLMVLSYNLKRVTNILGFDKFRDVCLQRVKTR